MNVLECAHDLGVSAILIHREGGYESRARELAEKTIHADLNDYAKLVSIVEQLHADRPLARIISLTEDGLVPAARLNERFGLGGNSVRVAMGLKNKALMRRMLDRRGLSPVRWRLVSDAADTLDFCERLGKWQIILKPVDGAASVDVHRLASPTEIEQAWRLLGHRDMLVEECLTGTEISVEAFSHQGRHTVVAFTDKTLTQSLVEVGHTIPSAVPAATKETAAALVTEFLDTMELKEGPSHTEIIITEDGPRIVESHNRIGGGSLRELIQIAYGVDFVRLTLAVSLGLEPGLHTPPERIAGAAVRFFTPEPGMIERFEGLDEFTNDDDVSIHMTANPGDIVPPLRSSYDRTVGFVVARGRDALQAKSRCEAALSAVRIITSPQRGMNPVMTKGGR
ncbi:MAG: ATP-grasp domain-containing protein [Micromonosporaceae bacterium]